MTASTLILSLRSNTGELKCISPIPQALHPLLAWLGRCISFDCLNSISVPKPSLLLVMQFRLLAPCPVSCDCLAKLTGLGIFSTGCSALIDQPFLQRHHVSYPSSFNQAVHLVKRSQNNKWFMCIPELDLTRILQGRQLQIYLHCIEADTEAQRI